MFGWFQSQQIKGEYDREADLLHKKYEALLTEEHRTFSLKQQVIQQNIAKVERNRQLAEALKLRELLVQPGNFSEQGVHCLRPVKISIWFFDHWCYPGSILLTCRTASVAFVCCNNLEHEEGFERCQRFSHFLSLTGTNWVITSAVFSYTFVSTTHLNMDRIVGFLKWDWCGGDRRCLSRAAIFGLSTWL
jgi:hypothetical protein